MLKRIVGEKKADARVGQQRLEPGGLQKRQRQGGRCAQPAVIPSIPRGQQGPGALVKQLGNQLECALAVAALRYQRLDLSAIQGRGPQHGGHHFVVTAIYLGKQLH